MGAAHHAHICAATADTARHFAELEIKMIILYICSEANSQLVTEREALKDALNTCLRPESFLRLENLKVLAAAAAHTSFLTVAHAGCFFDARVQQWGAAEAS